MLIVPRKRIWTQQPQQGAQVDWSAPINRRLAFAMASGGDVDAVSLTKSTPSASSKKGVSSEGVGVKCTGLEAGAEQIAFSNPAADVFKSAATLHVLVTISGNVSAIPRIGVCAKTTTGTSGWGLTLWYGTPLFNIYGTGTDLALYSTTTLQDGKKYLISVTVPSGTPIASGAHIYINAVDTTSGDPSSTGISNTDSSLPLKVGGGGNSIYDFMGIISYVSLVRREQTIEEIIAVAENPWQIFRAPDSRIFVPTGAGAGDGENLTASSIIASPATVGSPLLSQKHALSASSIASAPAVVASPVITQRNALSATVVSASSAVVGSPSITQRHALTATAISSGPAVVGSPTLTEIVAGILSALPIVSAPAVIGTPAITQRHALSAGAISAGPATFGTPTLTQQHALMAQGITASVAVVGEPALSEGGAVIFTRAPNGGGYSRAGENHTRPPQTNTVRH